MDEYDTSVPPITSPLDTFTSLFQCSLPQSSNVYGIVLSFTDSIIPSRVLVLTFGVVVTNVAPPVN